MRVLRAEGRAEGVDAGHGAAVVLLVVNFKKYNIISTPFLRLSNISIHFSKLSRIYIHFLN